MQKGKMRFIEVETKNRTADFINRLLTVWESSVRATHLFLSDSEIKKIAVPNDIEKLNFSDYQEQKEKEAEKSIVGKCPKCGNNIVLKKSFYGCSNYPECTFTLAEHFRKKKLTKTNVKELLEGKETLVKGIKTKDRKSYNAVVKIGEKGYIDFISFSK